MQTDPEVEAQVEQIALMRIAELRTLYIATFRTDPPEAFGPDLLRRSIAYYIQEKAYGGLDPATRRLLNNLMAQQAKSKDGRIVIPRRIKSGAVLVRVWKDQSHRVKVLEDGFAYAGKTYASLSEIARLITGARWNGPRFFGLRSDGRDSDK
jgi:hypothetical protein